jgi:hypothetical protein
MKKLFFAVLCITVMFMAGTNLKAQEVTLELLPGWNWIAYPYCETVDLTTAFGSFTPMTGDIIKSQYGSSSFRYSQWRGAVQNLNAGEGYHYFSTRTEPVILVFGLPSIPIGPLTVTTSEPTNITSTTATCGGSAVSNDGTSILMKGVCWATHPQPTTNDSYSEDVNAPGDFTTTITELDPETVYYVRAYAVSVKGINYGEELSFTTSSPGILNGLFSVSENNQVYFSQGNLQYQASTNTWRFAENQWDYVGDNTLGTVYENGVKSDNALISSTYDGWIDLFCWGTGNDPTHVSPRPWEVFVDWGINPITNGGNYPNQWLTLSLEELWYLFNSRNTPSGIRFVKAVVNDINGIVLLPDDWQESYYTLNNPNSGNSSYASNTISLDDWALLESYGAVFFPAAGMRYGNIYDSGSRGQYWSCTDMYFDDRGHTMAFSDEGFSIGEGLAYYKDFGQSVRLVQFVQTPSFNINATPNHEEYGSVNGGGVYELGQTCTLTAVPNEGYTFVNWKTDGIVVSTENTYSFTVRSNKNYVANFYENSTYPLTYSYNEDDHTATVTGRVEGVELGELVIPETVLHNGDFYTVTAIGQWAFADCMSLASVSIPNTVTAIGAQAFIYCYNLVSVSLPSGITLIPHGLFQSCGNLASITIPSGVTFISSYAFLGCYSLASLTVLAETPPVLDNESLGDIFIDVDKTIPVYIPCGSIEAYQNAEGWNEFTNFIEMCDTVPTGAINGKFTINADGDQVYFSQGNLQYQASTNTWKFAENQYDYVGSDNSNISSTYDGWIDLFGWGTSGYNHGANCYQPWSISRFYDNYYAYSDSYYNLNDQTGQADWGYNPISNGCNQPNQWRTLTNYEWWFLLYQRTTTSGIRYVKACVNGVNGVILLPDDWSTDIYSLSNTNNNEASFNSNVISASQWTTLENAGAVFLSAAGNRDGTLTNNVGSNGNYWSASNYYGSGSACCMDFNASHLYTTQNYRYCGFSVRVVCPAEN